MNRVDEDKLKWSLTQNLETWLDEAMDNVERRFYLTPDTAELMAAAALVVLRTMVDMEASLQRDGRLTD